MTNEELATIKTSMASELTECVGDHIKLMGVILRLRDEAAELLHKGPGPYVRPKVQPEPAGGQSVAERPGYVLKHDEAAPKGLPIAEENPYAENDAYARMMGTDEDTIALTHAVLRNAPKLGRPAPKANDEKRKDKR